MENNMEIPKADKAYQDVQRQRVDKWHSNLEEEIQRAIRINDTHANIWHGNNIPKDVIDKSKEDLIALGYNILDLKDRFIVSWGQNNRGLYIEHVVMPTVGGLVVLACITMGVVTLILLIW